MSIKKIRNIVSALCLVLVSSFSYAAGEVVVVDMRAAILKSNNGMLAAEKLKATIATDEASLMAIQEELKELKARIDKDSAIMSAEERRKLEQEGNNRMADYQHEGKKLQKKAKEAEQSLFKSLLPEFERAVKSVMEENKYGMILRREAALLVTPEKDITEQVIAKMNK